MEAEGGVPGSRKWSGGRIKGQGKLRDQGRDRHQCRFRSGQNGIRGHEEVKMGSGSQ